jgi:hypothetical protein
MPCAVVYLTCPTARYTPRWSGSALAPVAESGWVAGETKMVGGQNYRLRLPAGIPAFAERALW